MGYYKKSDTTHKTPLPEPPIPLSNQFLPLSFICSGGSLYKMYQKEKTERDEGVYTFFGADPRATTNQPNRLFQSTGGLVMN